MSIGLSCTTKRKLLFLKHLFTTLSRRTLSLELPKIFNDETYMLHIISDAPHTAVEVTKEQAFNMYRQMDLIRKMENHFADMYRNKKIRGFCHLYNGQEACAVGIKANMTDKDTVITSYRCHGWCMLMENDNIFPIVSELLGKKRGAARGKGGSMHLYARNFYGGNGIVAAHIPLGTGVALQHKYLNTNGVSITAYGDGAANQGQTYESYNIAKLQMLPVLFVIENNNFAMGTAAPRGSACTNFHKCCSYIPGLRCDGMDVLAVKEASRFALDFVRKGNGPMILELMTYRYFGHSLSDPGTSYRTRDDIKKVRDERDPIMLFKKKIIASELGSEDDLKHIELDNKKKVDDTMNKGQQEKDVGVEEMPGDVYRDFKGTIRLVGAYHRTPHKNYGKYT